MVFSPFFPLVPLLIALPLRLPELDTHLSDDIKQIETRFPALLKQQTDFYNAELSRAVRLCSVWI